MTLTKLLQLYGKYSPVINIAARVIFVGSLYRQVAPKRLWARLQMQPFPVRPVTCAIFDRSAALLGAVRDPERTSVFVSACSSLCI